MPRKTKAICFVVVFVTLLGGWIASRIQRHRATPPGARWSWFNQFGISELNGVSSFSGILLGTYGIPMAVGRDGFSGTVLVLQTNSTEGKVAIFFPSNDRAASSFASSVTVGRSYNLPIDYLEWCKTNTATTSK